MCCPGRMRWPTLVVPALVTAPAPTMPRGKRDFQKLVDVAQGANVVVLTDFHAGEHQDRIGTGGRRQRPAANAATVAANRVVPGGPALNSHPSGGRLHRHRRLPLKRAKPDGNTFAMSGATLPRRDQEAAALDLSMVRGSPARRSGVAQRPQAMLPTASRTIATYSWSGFQVLNVSTWSGHNAVESLRQKAAPNRRSPDDGYILVLVRIHQVHSVVDR